MTSAAVVLSSILTTSQLTIIMGSPSWKHRVLCVWITHGVDGQLI